MEKLLKRIESLILATKQSLEIKPTAPIISPAMRATARGACILPGPSDENTNIEGTITRIPSRIRVERGVRNPSVFETA